MGDKVSRGDVFKPSARFWNTIVDIKTAHQMAGHDISAKTATPKPHVPGVLKIKNNSGTNIAQFKPVGIDQPLWLPATNEEQFKQIPPVGKGQPAIADAHVAKWGIAVEPIKAGKIGPIVVDGLVPAKIEVSSEADTDGMEFVEIDSSGNLSLTDAGKAYVVWRESGTGTKWAWLQLGIPSEPPPVCGDLPLLDTFDDTSGTPIADHLMNRGCGWKPWAGAGGTIQGNVLNMATTSAGHFTETNTHVHKIILDFNLGTAASEIEVSAGVRFIDGNNNWRSALRIRTGSSYRLEIWSRVTAVSTKRVDNALSSGGGFGLPYTLTAETDGSHIIADVTGGGIGAATYTSAILNGSKRVGFYHAVSGSYTVQTNFTRVSVV